jgi:hypothetical protein
MSRIPLFSLACLSLLPVTALAETITVTRGADIQPALESLGATGGTLVLATGDVTLEAGLVYSGTAPLTVLGMGQTLRLDAEGDIFAVNQGADLSMVGLTLEGPGGFSILNQGNGKGLFVDVRGDQTGTARLSLTDVTVRGVASHGIHVSDCTLADDCGGGSGGAGEGSEASIALVLTRVIVENVGAGRFDSDGVRVDERGAGDITATFTNSIFRGVGADGVELDEGQAGSVILRDTGSIYDANGHYCDPAVLNAFLPMPPEAAFAKGAMADTAIPAVVMDSPDNICIERAVDLYEDGTVEEYEFSLDLDDGIDIDEAGPGDIDAVMIGAQVTGNLDEGVDFDEEGPGGILLTFTSGTATGNTDDAVKLSEEDAGDVMAEVRVSLAADNGGKGFVFEEAGDGNLMALLSGAKTRANDDGDDTGLEIVQEDAGTGTLQLMASELEDGLNLEGVTQ